MRYVVLVLAILGALTTGFLGYAWRTNAVEKKDMIEMTRGLVEVGFAGEEGKAELVEFDKRAKAWPYLFIGAALGIVGGVLAFLRKGMFAALVLVAGAILPAIFNPSSLLFTCPLILAGLLAFFVRGVPAPVPEPGKPAYA
jgi:hypothetical protein